MSLGTRVALGLMLLAALVAVLELFIEWAPFGRQHALAERELSRALGREVQIAGDLHLKLIPRLEFEATDVTVASRPGRPPARLLEIGKLELELALLPLLRRDVEIEALYVSDAHLWLGPGEAGDLGDTLDPERLTRGPDTPGSDFRLQVQKVKLSNVTVSYAGGAGDELTSLRIDALSLQTRNHEGPLQLAARGEVSGGSFELTGQLGPVSELLKPTAPYPIQLEGQFLEAKLELEGTIAKPIELSGLDLALHAELPELGQLYGERKGELARLGAVRLRSRLRDPNGHLGLYEIHLESLAPDWLRAHVRGSVRRIGNVKGIELAAEIETDELHWLEPLLERELPEHSSLVAKLTASDADGSLGIEGEVHVKTPQNGVTLDLHGRYGDLPGADDLDVRVQLRARDIATLAQAAAVEPEVERALPQIGPVSATGRVTAQDGIFSLEDLQLAIGDEAGTWTKLVGSVQHLGELRGVDVQVSFGARSLEELARQLGRQGSLPDVGPLHGSGRLTDADGSLGVEGFRLRGGVASLFHIDLAGEFDDLREIDEVSLEARLGARDAAVIGALLGAELPAIGPVEFSGRVKGSDERLVSSGFVRLNRTRLEGEWTASFAPDSRPRLDANLSSPHIYLDDLVALFRAIRGARGGVQAPAKKRSEAIDLEGLRTVDATVTLRVQRISGSAGVELSDIRADIELEDGDLSVRDVRLAYQEGTITADLRVDARTPEPAYTLRLDAKGVDLQRFAKQFGLEGSVDSGRLEISLELTSQGGSLPEIRRGLSGRAGFVIQDWSARHIREFTRNLRNVLVRFRGPQSGGAPSRGCIAADFQLRDGIAHVEQLILANKEATILGTGSVDLGRGSYDLKLIPRLHDPSLLSIAAGATVKGPFADPQIRPIKLSIASNYIRTLFGTALTPADLLLRRGAGRTRASPCESIAVPETSVASGPGAASNTE